MSSSPTHTSRRSPEGRTAMLSPTISFEKLNHGNVLGYVEGRLLEALRGSRALPGLSSEILRLTVPPLTSGALSPTPIYSRVGRFFDTSLGFKGDSLSLRPLPRGYTTVLRSSEAPPYLFSFNLRDASYRNDRFERKYYRLLAKTPPLWLNTPVNLGKSVQVGTDHPKALQWEVIKVRIYEPDTPGPAVPLKPWSKRGDLWALREAEVERELLSHVLLQQDLSWEIQRHAWKAEITRYPLQHCWGLEDVLLRFNTTVLSSIKPLPKHKVRATHLSGVTVMYGGASVMCVLPMYFPTVGYALEKTYPGINNSYDRS